MVLRAGSEFPLNTGPWEEAWQKAASSDRMGWGLEWAHLRHPSRCKPHSCISARCSAGKRNTHTYTQDLSYLCPAVERWLCRFLWNTLVVFPSLAWTLANFCLPELKNVFFHWNFQVSNSSYTINEIRTKMDRTNACRHRAMPKLWDLGALPSSSVQFSVSSTSWLNANQIANAVPHLLPVAVSMGKEYRRTNQEEICLPS